MIFLAAGRASVSGDFPEAGRRAMERSLSPSNAVLPARYVAEDSNLQGEKVTARRIGIGRSQ